MEDEAGKPEIVDDANAPQFSAFISYSHADAAAVRKLHSQIESYRLPQGLGSIDALNRSKSRVGKIFRDREDLSAAHDLSTAVRHALAHSQVLVVACSPDAKASQWVDQEIEFFRECHPDRPILAAILRGEPQEAFPSALMQGGVEPLAADLRKQGDGWRLGFLKIVAGIAGVPLDRLVQRDSQRQVRRVMAVTGLVALVAVAMGVMTTIALQARTEAEAQRAEAERQRGGAEGLVAYLLGDLRDDLEGVGRLDVMVGVNERALEYFESLGDISALPDSSLELNATTLHRIGQDELRLKGGSIQTAQRIFGQAYRTTEFLLKRDPKNGDRIFSHAQSAFWVGDAAYKQEQWEDANRAWNEYFDLAKRLESVPDQKAGWALELGYSLGNLCTLSVHRTDIDESSLSTCDRAYREVASELAKDPLQPKVRSALANRLGWLADAQAKDGDLSSALDSRERQHDILEELATEEPENAAKADQLMRAKMTLADAELEIGNDAESERLREDALQLAERMILIDPENLWWAHWKNEIESE